MEVVTSTKTVVGVFNSMQIARNVVAELEKAGFSRDEINVVANKALSGEAATTAGTPAAASGSERGSSVASDAGIGAALGGVGGLLLSFAALAIPGVGPVLAVGPIVAALSGAGLGAVAGGMIGALTESGIPEEDAQYYAEGVRRGNVLVTVHAGAGQVDRAREIMDAEGAVDVAGQVSSWRSRGWTGYNAGAEPLSADELRREREYSAASKTQEEEWDRYPHAEAHDVEESLPKIQKQTVVMNQPVQAGGQLPLRDTAMESEEYEDPSQLSDAMDNNVHRPDRAVLRAEGGFDRAMESTVRSARRMAAARVYDRNKS